MTIESTTITTRHTIKPTQIPTIMIRPSQGSTNSKSFSWMDRFEKRLPFRVTFKMRLIGVMTTVFLIFFTLLFLVLYSITNEHAANAFTFRTHVTNIPLQIRRHRFEEALAATFAKEPLVLYVVDELVARMGIQLRQVLQLVRVHSKRHANGMKANDILQFLFGTEDRQIGGGIGWKVDDIRFIVETPMVEEEGDLFESPLTSPNLREKMTLLYIATMQPIQEKKLKLLKGADSLLESEVQFFTIQSKDEEVALDSPPTKPTIFPLSLIFHRVLHHPDYVGWNPDFGNFVQLDTTLLKSKYAYEMSGPVHATHLHRAAADTTFIRRCFIPFFVPREGPVRGCRCLDAERETTHGCRQVSEDWIAGLTSTDSVKSPWFGERTASSVTTPPLSRREFAFALGMNVSGMSDSDILASHEWRHTPLPWVSGSHIFVSPDESHNPSQQLLQSIAHHRFVAGPSSTTDAFLQLGQYFNLGDPDSLYLIRLALIAYLVPGYDHSILEILAASDPFDLKPNLNDLLDETLNNRFEFSSIQAFTHLIPTSLCLKNVRLDRKLVNPSGLQLPLDLDCSNSNDDGGGTRLTRLELNHAISLELIRVFSPIQFHHAREAWIKQLPTSPTSTSPLCSEELNYYWTFLGLNDYHVDDPTVRGQSTAEWFGSSIACHPDLFLRWLTKAIYQ